MSIQTIKTADGKDYVLLPVDIYQALKHQIDDKMAETAHDEDLYVPFLIEDYVDNPIAQARIKAGITQKELASRLGVTQAYISKVEAQDKVTAKLMARVRSVLG